MGDVVDLVHVQAKREELHRFTVDFFDTDGTYTGIIQLPDGNSTPDNEAMAEALELLAAALRHKDGLAEDPLVASVQVFASGVTELRLPSILDFACRDWLRQRLSDAVDGVPAMEGQ